MLALYELVQRERLYQQMALRRQRHSKVSIIYLKTKWLRVYNLKRKRKKKRKKKKIIT
jgi:hypothetical protein